MTVVTNQPKSRSISGQSAFPRIFLHQNWCKKEKIKTVFFHGPNNPLFEVLSALQLIEVERSSGQNEKRLRFLNVSLNNQFFERDQLPLRAPKKLEEER